MKIMAIDDETGILDTLERFLSVRGYEIITYSNSAEALKAVETGEVSDVDLVLLDLRMPNVDGRTILARVKKDTDKPVLVLTGSLQASKVKELGADDVIFKPVKMDELLEKIRELSGEENG